MPIYFDCGQCGDIGRVDQLVEHPTRPMPTDIGFCPKCESEIDYLITEEQVRALLAEYGEEADAFFNSLPSKES